MTTARGPSIDKRALTATGVEALNRGDARAARAAFQAIAAAGLADASTWLGLAYACRGLSDPAAARAAVDKALELEPRNVRALIFMADDLAAAGDGRAACSFYVAAIDAASGIGPLPADLRAEVSRARAMRDRYAVEFESFLRQRIGADAAASERFAESLEIVSGKKQIYLQQPRYYYFPGLAAIPFRDRAAFPFLDRVEAATDEIRGELVKLLQEEASAFRPYVQGEPGRPRHEQAGMLDNPDWSAFYLWKAGEIVAANAARFPKTMQVFADVPLTRVANRSPSVLFSLLRPGAHIPPHTGMVNTRLICHLPLIVPGDCAFRVGNETREWVEGEAWVFDDTIEHEAWNRSDRTRVILIFEIWKPELTEVERRLVNAMFEAIDAYTGQKPTWEI